jgi:hypothetical protein
MAAERMWRRRARRSLIAVLAVGIGMAALGSPASAPGDDLIPDLQALFFTPFTPSELPARGSTPIRLSLLAKIKTQTGEPPPALQELQVELDRQLAVDVEGLPVCNPALAYQHRSSTRRRDPCRKAEVGSGGIGVKVAFPEQQPVKVEGSLSVYNGGAPRGHATFWLRAYLPAPITGTVVMQLKLHREVNGRYGWIGRVEVPEIANGSGSITHFEFPFDKGIFSATCPGGDLQTHSTSRFADGTLLGVTDVHACRA